MNENGIGWSRAASVLRHCLLPMAILSGFSVVLKLDNIIGIALTVISFSWCTYSSSGMFSSVLHFK
jgi:hypothetical protein